MEQQVPGFLVRFVSAPRPGRGEGEGPILADQYYVGRQNVPDSLRNEVNREEVHLAEFVGMGQAGGPDVATVGWPDAASDGLDLHPLILSVMLDSDVIVLGIAPGLGDPESALGGVGHETEFGPFAAALSILHIA